MREHRPLALWVPEQQVTFDRLLVSAVMQLMAQRGGIGEASPWAEDVYTKVARMISGLMEFAHRLERLSAAVGGGENQRINGAESVPE